MANKAELQEEALQLEVSIYYPEGHNKEGKELINADLAKAIATKTAQLEQEKSERDAAAERAREPTDDEDGEEDGEEDEDEDEDDPPVAASPPRKRNKTRAPVVIVRDPDPSLVQALGLKAPTDKDRALAKKHNYPIAIPGGKAYRTRVSFNCSMGGHLRPMGSIVILTPEQARHKADYITKV